MKFYRTGRPPKPRRDNIISTSIRVDRDLWVSIKAEAALENLTIDEYIEQILRNRTISKKRLDMSTLIW